MIQRHGQLTLKFVSYDCHRYIKINNWNGKLFTMLL